MSYLKEFLTQIKNRNFHKFLVLWEEYSSSESVDVEEFSQLLKAIKGSDLAPHFGKIIETALPLWKTIENEEEAYEILRLLIDLQVTNHPQLAEVTMEALEKKYGKLPKYNEHLRIIGIRNSDNFQGALSRYDLLMHMCKGNIVFHTGGWGTGEIMDVSHVRENLTIEFENVSGRKDISFTNAFKVLIPLSAKHFLARRFSDADNLEKEGLEDAIKLITLLLHDMGPKTAAEIKDELCELVISENIWAKWWQGTRTKIKKNALIATPDSIKESFYLRKTELSPEERLKQVMHNKNAIDDIIQTTYSFVRDTPGALANPTTKKDLQDKLLDLLESKDIKEEHQLQICFLLDQFFNYPESSKLIANILQTPSTENLLQIIHRIEIIAFKKRALLAIKEHLPEWPALFLSLLMTISQTQLRDYLLKELNQGSLKADLQVKLDELLHHPVKYPEMFVWYFQKLMTDKEDIPYQNEAGRYQFFESFFILLSVIESQPEFRELAKKMYVLISAKRYELIRQMLKGTTLEYAKEFLLLISKCQSLSDHDLKILRSLVEVVHPSLGQTKNKKDREQEEESGEIWTTEEGYLKLQERIRQIGTIEVVENAREIEAARALGDLRENSEFKFAQEKRARLQAELTSLSEQLKRARLITPVDISSEVVGVGNIVELEDSKGKLASYSILGPWDAQAEDNILSFNSKFALAITGKKQGATFQFRDESYRIISLKSYFDK